MAYRSRKRVRSIGEGGGVIHTGIASFTSHSDIARQLELAVDKSIQKGDIPVKKAMTEVLEYIKQRLVKRIRHNHPTSDTFINAPYVSYTGGSLPAAGSVKYKGGGGFDTGEELVGEVGLNAAGLTDPVTGRPLSEYMAALQSPEQGQVRGSGAIRYTQPPESPILPTVGGKTIFTWRFKNRILPWVRQHFGVAGGAARAIAITVARNIDERGVQRRPLWTQIFKTPRTADGTLLGSVRPEVGDQVIKIIKRNGIRVERDIYAAGKERGRPARGKPYSRGGATAKRRRRRR